MYEFDCHASLFWAPPALNNIIKIIILTLTLQLLGVSILITVSLLRVQDDDKLLCKQLWLLEKKVWYSKSKLKVIAENSDWLISLFSPLVIGWNNFFGSSFWIVVWIALKTWDASSNISGFIWARGESVGVLVEYSLLSHSWSLNTGSWMTMKGKRRLGFQHEIPVV